RPRRPLWRDPDSRLHPPPGALDRRAGRHRLQGRIRGQLRRREDGAGPERSRLRDGFQEGNGQAARPHPAAPCPLAPPTGPPSPSQRARWRDVSAKPAIDGARVAADGEGLRGPGASIVQRVEVPPAVKADPQKAVDRLLEMLGRPAPPATVLREALYGRPAEIELAELLESPASYTGKAVRLRGQLEAAGAGYRLVNGEQSLHVVPEADLANFVHAQAPAWKNQDVELVGLFRRGDESMAGPAGFLVAFWECGPSEAEASPAPGAPALRTTVAALLAAPQMAAGQTVRVLGKFRGRNLF